MREKFDLELVVIFFDPLENSEGLHGENAVAILGKTTSPFVPVPVSQSHVMKMETPRELLVRIPQESYRNMFAINQFQDEKPYHFTTATVA